LDFLNDLTQQGLKQPGHCPVVPAQVFSTFASLSFSETDVGQHLFQKMIMTNPPCILLPDALRITISLQTILKFTLSQGGGQ
jgi:hypothetical protein